MTTGKAHLAVVTEEDRAWDENSDAIRAAEHGFERARELALRIRESLRSVIWGQDAIVDGVVLALFAGGHVLLEGAPGLGKTQLVRTLSTLVGGSFARIQFTPDLMPSDIVGTSLVVTTESGSKDLQYRRGPIFANLVLADEINRATPKTQSALLEAMGERTVSVDGTSMSLPQPFFVLATENPIEMEGVFPLPEAQLDRFLLKLLLRMPSLDALTRIGARPVEPAPLAHITTPEELARAQGIARTVPSAEFVERYAAKLVLATHALPGVRYGAGPRAAQSLMACGRVRALLEGRVAVSIEDVRSVAPDILRHRIVLGFEAEAHGRDADSYVVEALEKTTVD
jgi:MoxR-like ATPase